MKPKAVVISSAHGLRIRGAHGPTPWGLDEVDESRRVVARTADYLRQHGVEVIIFHDDVSKTQATNLKHIIAFHNGVKKRDLDCSIHFNAFQRTTTVPRGTETLYFSQAKWATKVSAAISKASGLHDRGGKRRNNLAFLKTAKPALLVEVCFVDAKIDCDLYRANFDRICKAIAEAIAAGA